MLNLRTLICKIYVFLINLSNPAISGQFLPQTIFFYKTFDLPSRQFNSIKHSTWNTIKQCRSKHNLLVLHNQLIGNEILMLTLIFPGE